MLLTTLSNSTSLVFTTNPLAAPPRSTTEFWLSVTELLLPDKITGSSRTLGELPGVWPVTFGCPETATTTAVLLLTLHIL